MSYVNKKINNKNIHELYTSDYPDKMLPISQNHKKRFSDNLV